MPILSVLPAPSEEFVRVVAIGVQGLTESRPRMLPRTLVGYDRSKWVIWSHRSFEYVGEVQRLLETVRFYRTRSLDHSLSERYFVYTYCDKFKQWTKDSEYGDDEFYDREMFNLSQQKVEARAAVAYTHPYPVLHVSKDSIALARDIIRVCDGGRR